MVRIPCKKMAVWSASLRQTGNIKVKGVVPPRDSYLLVRSLLDTYAPAATPSTAPNQTDPCSLSGLPSRSSANQGFVWTLVLPRRLSNTLMPACTVPH